MTYIENPKTKGSGIICAIPQTGRCPVGCADCFFQSGRSFLEPLDENLPNVPSAVEADGCVVRINDGLDSNVQRDVAEECAQQYQDAFFNTSIPRDLQDFSRPVVLTVNPGNMTDKDFHKLDPVPEQLMFVRVRTNMWNAGVVSKAINYYCSRGVPVVLTFMAYYGETVPPEWSEYYDFQKRTLNSYWVLNWRGWSSYRRMIEGIDKRHLISTCGRDYDRHPCRDCGVCLREYYATKVRIS